MPIVNQNKFDKEANCFVKNIDPAVTNKEFDEFFKKYGDIVTSSLRTDENGESLCYGYVQFSNP